MVNLKNKKHLFFDLDDTLWDFEKNSSLILKEIFVQFELGIKLQTSFINFYKEYKGINNQLWSKYYKKEIDKTYLRNHRFNETFKRFNYSNYDENLLVTEQYLKRSPQGKILKKDCIETLMYLKQYFQLNIITNGFKEVQDIKIDTCGLRSYFSNIIISEEYNLTKPDEQIFRLAESFSKTTKDECIMIGDNLESDIKGALNAGWEAIYFSDIKPNDFKGYYIKNLRELKTLLT